LKDIVLHRAILEEFGHLLDSSSLILDFGCGEGQMVDDYRRAGLQAFGADVLIPHPNEWLRPIDPQNYRIPFPDNTFDFVYSNSVLEHVRELETALSEIRRVLKPGGASLHLFPPPAKPIEPHVFVPFGGLLQARWWLMLWAWLGVRNSFQRNKSAADTTRGNQAYLSEHTFYRFKPQLRREFGRHFRNVTFADFQMIKHSYGSGRYLKPVAAAVPAVALLYGSLHQRCVFFEKAPDGHWLSHPVLG
jgi:SAM-dependent methyltransferase